jgi:hypothetical protein
VSGRRGLRPPSRGKGALCRRRRGEGHLPVPVLRAVVIVARPSGWSSAKMADDDTAGSPRSTATPNPLGRATYKPQDVVAWQEGAGSSAEDFIHRIGPQASPRNPQVIHRVVPSRERSRIGSHGPRRERNHGRARARSSSRAERWNPRTEHRRAASQPPPRGDQASEPRVIPRRGARGWRGVVERAARGDLLSYPTCDMAETERSAQPGRGSYRDRRPDPRSHHRPSASR